MSNQPSVIKKVLPVIALREVVIYPSIVAPLFVGRKKSVSAIQACDSMEVKQVILAAQNEVDDDPSIKDLYKYGTLAEVVQLVKLQDSTYKLLVEGKSRVVLDDIYLEDGHFKASFRELIPVPATEIELLETIDTVRQAFASYLKTAKAAKVKVATDIIDVVNKELDLTYLLDFMASNLNLSFDVKQSILSEPSVLLRAQILVDELDLYCERFDLDKTIQHRVRKQIDKNQRNYFLNEQIKAIKKELGEDLSTSENTDKLETDIQKAKMPADVEKKALDELKKLKMLAPISSEASVLRTYLDWLVKLPWNKANRLTSNLSKAQHDLDVDHHGLKDVKERIIECLAVQQRTKSQQGPILCLVGPPGVGKTSLGESIARATGRKFARMSLGGVRDEAEIRGHRRTYIGSLPGKIIQKIARIGSKNPLFLFDEIDKLGSDFRGDPASALLEVLDPEQNVTFSDHYLEVDFDLSKVMFICTANSMNIPQALLDRMEVIRIPGYTDEEKLQIAQKYLVPKQSVANGLKKSELEISTKAILSIIHNFTRESGVRNLKREIDKLVRKVVTENVLQSKLALKGRKKTGLDKKIIDSNDLENYLGIAKYRNKRAKKENVIGRVTGLAWTSSGGELLSIEVASLNGKGNTIKTGSLGEVMQESIQAALTVVRSRVTAFNIAPDFYKNTDLHIHVPEGATPKDGPSAGIGMCTAIVSELTSIPVCCDVAMTGEITLKGEVLPIGGVKEKLLAAHQRGIKTVILPKSNLRELKEIDQAIISGLNIEPVEWIDQVIDLALESVPECGTNNSIEEASPNLANTITVEDNSKSAH